jgi:hypothetical protein
MTQEQKDILLKDLCARLPYGVKAEYENKIFDVEYVCPMYEEIKLDIPETWTIDVSEVKPYLLPMSSMSEEQYYEMEKIVSDDYLENMQVTKEMRERVDFITHFPIYCPNVIDWFIKNHFDYRGLIPMGLAIDATGLNIY